MKQFGRKYTLYISGPKYPIYGENITAAREIKDPIHITFDISKSILLEPNFGRITLYNLSPNTEREIIQQGSEVILTAGYEDNEGVIFKGQVFQPIRGKEGGDTYYLTLIVIDGDSYLNLAYNSSTLEANSTRQQLVNQILRDSTVQLDSVDLSELPNYNSIDGSTPVSERAKVIFGNPGKYLNDIARMSNSTFYVEDGVGKFFNPIKKGTLVEAHNINVDTGMIGNPRQIDNGVEVQCLLNSSIKLGDFIQIDNKKVILNEYNYGDIPRLLDADGLYRIIKINYKGDSRGRDWYTNLTTITQAGNTPDMMIGQYGEMIL